MMMPRKFVWSTFCILCELMYRSGGVIFLCGVWNVIAFVFVGLRDSLLAQNHLKTLLSSLLRLLVDECELSEVISVVSSA